MFSLTTDYKYYKYSGQFYIVLCNGCIPIFPITDPSRICPRCCLHNIMTKMLLPPDEPLSKDDLQPLYDGKNLLSIPVMTMAHQLQNTSSEYFSKISFQ